MKKQTTIYTLKKKDTDAKRRGKGQGTIWQEKNGKWRGQLSVGVKLNGSSERRSFSGATRDEVQRKMNDFIQLANLPVSSFVAPGVPGENPEMVVNVRVTVAQIIHRWLWDYKRIEICTKTCEWYGHLIHKMIEPHIGGLVLSRVNALTVQSLINRLAMVDGYATRTVRGVRSILFQSFEFANQLGLMKGNPASSIKMPKLRRRGKGEDEKAIAPEVCAKVLQAAQNDPMMRAVITTLLFTGLRVGELLALRWCDVNFEEQILTVDEAVVRRPVYNEQGDRIALKNEVSEPKTEGSYRTVQLSPPVIEALQSWKTHLQSEKYGCWNTRDECFLFFNHKTRKPYTYSGFRCVYYRFLEKNDLRKYGLNLHSYRHTYATLLMEAGTNPRIVQLQLGHASINTTLGTYTHKTPALCKTVYTALENAYNQLNA